MASKFGITLESLLVSARGGHPQPLTLLVECVDRRDGPGRHLLLGNANGAVEIDDAVLHAHGTRRKVLEHRRQLAEEARPGRDLLGADPHLVLFGLRLVRTHLALVHGALHEQPGRHLHQPRRQPHAFSRIGDGDRPGQVLGLVTSRTVEIGRDLFHEIHSVAEQHLEPRRAGEPMGEADHIIAIDAGMNASHDGSSTGARSAKPGTGCFRLAQAQSSLVRVHSNIDHSNRNLNACLGLTGSAGQKKSCAKQL